MSLWLIFLSVFSVAFAKQIDHNVHKDPNEWTFDIEWADKKGNKQQVHFSLDAQDIKADLEEPLYFKRRPAAQYQAKAINDWAATQKGPQIKAKVRNGGVRIQGKGKNRRKVKAKMKEAKQVGNTALNQYIAEHGYVQLKGGIAPDHITHIKDAAPELQNLVDALGGPTPNPRVFANKALSFTQSIPYEKRGRMPDKYRRPLSTLGRNKADCDSKTVLFLALMHQAYPDMDLAVVYISGHAFGAMGVEAQKGDVTFRAQGHKWVAVEPVGPAMMRVGKVGSKSRRSLRLRRFQVRTVQNKNG